jgi:hypothetical protein
MPGGDPLHFLILAAYLNLHAYRKSQGRALCVSTSQFFGTVPRTENIYRIAKWHTLSIPDERKI